MTRIDVTEDPEDELCSIKRRALATAAKVWRPRRSGNLLTVDQWPYAGTAHAVIAKASRADECGLSHDEVLQTARAVVVDQLQSFLEANGNGEWWSHEATVDVIENYPHVAEFVDWEVARVYVAIDASEIRRRLAIWRAALDKVRALRTRAA